VNGAVKDKVPFEIIGFPLGKVLAPVPPEPTGKGELKLVIVTPLNVFPDIA
jgi:hypothetical protein